MITIDRTQYCIDILNWSDSYQQKLKQAMYKASSFIDTNYTRDILNELQSFAALIRMECLNDMTLLHNDMNYAKNMQSGYDNFADYCYDMMQQAFKATNDSLMQSNQLFYQLQQCIGNDIDVSIASNYIAFNLFGKGSVLELFNFRRMTGLGLCYDIRLKQQTIATSNLQEQMQPQFNEFIELAEVISQLKAGGQMHKAIDSWSEVVNDKLQDAKQSAMHAWNATYNAYKQQWFNVEFSKQNAQTYCTLSVTPKRVVEMLYKHGRAKKFDYGQNFMNVLTLDYVNNANFEFK